MRSVRHALGWALTALIFLGALATLAPDALSFLGDGLRLSPRYPVAQVVALRGPLVLAFGVVGVIFLVAAISRVLRHEGGVRTSVIGVVLVLAAVGHAAVLLDRGTHSVASLDAGTVATDPADWDGSLTVLTLNTYGDAADPVSLAVASRDAGADVLVLPETSTAYGQALAELLAEDGYAFTVFSAVGGPLVHDDEAAPSPSASPSPTPGSGEVPAEPAPTPTATEVPSADEVTRITTVLVSAALGAYEQVEGPQGAGFGTVQLEPTAEGMPTIVGVHTYPPVSGTMTGWQDSVEAVMGLCGADGPADLLMAGDFNATRDHAVLRDLGRCTDAGEQAGIAGLATWPTSSRTVLLGAAIDHVFTTADSWRVGDGQVLTIPGSDHRAVVVQLKDAMPS